VGKGDYLRHSDFIHSIDVAICDCRYGNWSCLRKYASMLLVGKICVGNSISIINKPIARDSHSR